jgi:hypothetical protein
VQTIAVSNTRSPCNRFYIRDFVNDLEIHRSYLNILFSLTIDSYFWSADVFSI